MLVRIDDSLRYYFCIFRQYFVNVDDTVAQQVSVLFKLIFLFLGKREGIYFVYKLVIIRKEER
jgi:hypothetical protein